MDKVSVQGEYGETEGWTKLGYRVSGEKQRGCPK